MKKKLIIVSIMLICIICTGCAMLESELSEIKGDLVGNSYNIYTYDNYGNEVMRASGEKINIKGNKVSSVTYGSSGVVETNYELSSVITINIDGEQIQSCGDTCIFVQSGLNHDVDFVQENINSTSESITDNTYFSNNINAYENMYGKSRVVVIKSQLGQPIVAFSGDSVYWEIPDNLPKMTKLMIDGKALYIHRANFQIIDKDLL